MYNYGILKSEEFAERWARLTEHLEMNLTTQYIVIGKQGAAMNVEPNAFTSERYNGTEPAPQVRIE